MLSLSSSPGFLSSSFSSSSFGQLPHEKEGIFNNLPEDRSYGRRQSIILFDIGEKERRVGRPLSYASARCRYTAQVYRHPSVFPCHLRGKAFFSTLPHSTNSPACEDSKHVLLPSVGQALVSCLLERTQFCGVSVSREKKQDVFPWLARPPCSSSFFLSLFVSLSLRVSSSSSSRILCSIGLGTKSEATGQQRQVQPTAGLTRTRKRGRRPSPCVEERRSWRVPYIFIYTFVDVFVRLSTRSLYLVRVYA